ncbi:phosphate-transport permease PitB [Alloscardovia venturai]|uniref:Phosphate-transport permease PitB n=1 Tax=Alloscardovia venturai TaxID=1769421 RepID=A0ABW2Y1Y6_9BIFI
MKKNIMGRITSSLAAVAATSMLLVGGATAFADDTSATTTSGAAGTSAEVTITKTLNIPEGVTAPNATFTFKFAAKGSDTNSAADTPAIADKTVNYANGDKNTVANGTTASDSYTGKINKETANLFDGVTYTATGEYVYTVSEANTGFTALTGSNGQTVDKMDFDKSEYEMHVIVKDNNGAKYISSVYFRQTKDAAGHDADSSTKVEPIAPGSHSYNLFKNTYTKEAGKTPEDPSTVDDTKKALTITKTVADTNGLGDKNKDFTFSLTFTAPQHDTTNDPIQTSYTANKVAKDGTKTPVTFTAGQAQTFTLKHGEKLEFDSLPAGVRYTLTENGTAHYTPSAKVVENGAAAVEVNGEKNAALTTPASATYLVGEKTNTNDVTNTYADDVPATGLLINNLPFIVMIGVAVALFAGLVIARRNRRA